MKLSKVVAQLPAGFVDQAEAMSSDALRAEIVRAETAIREVDREQEADDKLAGAREIARDIMGGYNEARRAQRAKIAYALHVIEQRGESGRDGGT